MKYKSFNYWTAESNDCPVDWLYSETYEIVVDMENNEVVCILGEPEDRTFTRDLSKLLTLLNAEHEAK